MKKKRINWARVPWTPFEECIVPDDPVNRLDPPTAILRNSRYQVTVYERLPNSNDHSIFGPMWHLSFRTLDRQAHHDWRDMQRLKNEICGPEYDAVEVFPAESKLVDAANQYHLWVFRDFKLPFGFQERLVGDGNWGNSKQRDFAPGERPADCLDPQQYQAAIDAALARKAAQSP